MDIGKMIKDALSDAPNDGPKARVRVFQANSLTDLISKIESATDETCDNEDCPVHGESGDEGLKLNAEDLEGMDSKLALKGALGATALAHNFLVSGEARLATVEQYQADLWLRISDAFARQETAERLAAQEKDWMDRVQQEAAPEKPDSRNEDETVS